MFEFAKKSYYRQKLNGILKEKQLYGLILDLGGNKDSSYRKIIKFSNYSKVITINIKKTGEDYLQADLEKGIPYKSRSADYILAFNIFEHVYNLQKLLDETYRVLKSNGKVILATPFLKEIHNDPDDFWRFSPTCWQRLLQNSGFNKIKIQSITAGPFLAAYTLFQTILPWQVCVIIYPVFLILDITFLSLRPKWKGKYLLGIYLDAEKIEDFV